jgi:hypothetical protein
MRRSNAIDREYNREYYVRVENADGLKPMPSPPAGSRVEAGNQALEARRCRR